MVKHSLAQMPLDSKAQGGEGRKVWGIASARASIASDAVLFGTKHAVNGQIMLSIGVFVEARLLRHEHDLPVHDKSCLSHYSYKKTVTLHHFCRISWSAVIVCTFFILPPPPSRCGRLSRERVGGRTERRTPAKRKDIEEGVLDLDTMGSQHV